MLDLDQNSKSALYLKYSWQPRNHSWIVVFLLELIPFLINRHDLQLNKAQPLTSIKPFCKWKLKHQWITHQGLAQKSKFVHFEDPEMNPESLWSNQNANHVLSFKNSNTKTHYECTAKCKRYRISQICPLNLGEEKSQPWMPKPSLIIWCFEKFICNRRLRCRRCLRAFWARWDSICGKWFVSV